MPPEAKQRGADTVFALRFHLSNWIGPEAEQVLDLPAAFVAFGLGMARLLAGDGGMHSIARKPLTF